jgi:hypothetical protein
MKGKAGGDGGASRGKTKFCSDRCQAHRQEQCSRIIRSKDGDGILRLIDVRLARNQQKVDRLI